MVITTNDTFQKTYISKYNPETENTPYRNFRMPSYNDTLTKILDETAYSKSNNLGNWSWFEKGILTDIEFQRSSLSEETYTNTVRLRTMDSPTHAFGLITLLTEIGYELQPKTTDAD